MEVQIAVSKIHKYAVSNSGDTVEVIERPNGGLSVVMADGQTSGRGAKWISTLVVRKVITLLSEGVRDGAAARAASDSLFTERNGRVSATLNILSVDQLTNTLVITRNNPAPVIIAHNDEIHLLSNESKPIGIYRDTRPSINEFDIVPGLTAVAFSDGLIHAGDRYGTKMDIVGYLQTLLEDEHPSPQFLANNLLECAIDLDQQRPTDDITIVVLSVFKNVGDRVRRMLVRLPLSA
jgi:serine phosphatase RsbU (regulator of sigma subunit)